MPLFEYECSECGEIQEHIDRFGDHKDAEYPCPFESLYTAVRRYEKFEQCPGIARYVGLSRTVVGKSHQFGVILNNGQKVAGHLNKAAPNKRLQKK